MSRPAVSARRTRSFLGSVSQMRSWWNHPEPETELGAVGAEGDGVDVVGVAAELGDLLVRCQVPEAESGSSLQPTARRVPSGLKATVYTVVPL